MSSPGNPVRFKPIIPAQGVPGPFSYGSSGTAVHGCVPPQPTSGKASCRSREYYGASRVSRRCSSSRRGLSVIGALTVSVVPSWRRSRCGSGSRRGPRYVGHAMRGRTTPPYCSAGARTTPPGASSAACEEPGPAPRGHRPGGTRNGRGAARRPRSVRGTAFEDQYPPGAVRPVRGRVDRDGGRPRRDPGARAPPAGGDRASGLQRAGEAGDRGTAPAEAPVRGNRGGVGVPVAGAGDGVSRRRTGRRPGRADRGGGGRGVVAGGTGGVDSGAAACRCRGVADGGVRGRRPLRAPCGPRGDPRPHGRGGRVGTEGEAGAGLPAGAGSPAAGSPGARGGHAGRRAGRAGRGRRRRAAPRRAGGNRTRAPAPGGQVGRRCREDQRLDRVAGTAAVEPAYDCAGRRGARPVGARRRARGPRAR